MSTKTPFEQLWEFQTAFDLPRSTTPGLPDAAERKLRRKLLTEEFNEYLEAELDDDIVEIADALGDVLYIAYGTAVSYGLSEGFEAPFPENSDAVPNLPPRDGLRVLSMTRLTGAWQEYTLAEFSNDLDLISANLLKLIGQAFYVAYAYGIPLKEIFDEIHASNMTKLDPATGKPIRREDGKVLKPATFRKPDLASIIERHQKQG